jgi:hypothetical protein
LAAGKHYLVYHDSLTLPFNRNTEARIMSHHEKHKSAPRKETESKPIEPPKEAESKTTEPPTLPKSKRLGTGDWIGIIATAIAIVTLLVNVFPTESHDLAINAPVRVLHWITRTRDQPILPADKLRRYTKFAISGSLQQSYTFSSDSTVMIDRETGFQLDANITVVGPTTREQFTAKPWYGTNAVWQWQGQGSLGGSLDFQNQPRTFVEYIGGKPLTNSAYTTPSLKNAVISTNTILKPIATSDTYP